MHRWHRWAAVMLVLLFFYATALPGGLLRALLLPREAVAAHETRTKPAPSQAVPLETPRTQEVASTLERAEPEPVHVRATQAPGAEGTPAPSAPAPVPAEERHPERPWTPPETVRVMTFNIRHALGLDGQVSLERVAEAIAQADIVFLCEVDRFWLRSGLRDQPAVLRELSGLSYAYFAPALDLPGPSRQYGNLLLSRFPIVRAETVPLPQPRRAEARVMLEAEIDVEGQIWTVFGVHLGLDQHERLLQVQAIQARAQAAGPARILLGDFNAPVTAAELETLWAPGEPLWIDGLPGGPPTYPAWEPRSRIDHIFLSPALAIRELAWGVETCQASDHLPVWVELILPARAR